MSQLVLSALWDAVIMVSNFFVFKMKPFLQNQWLTLLRSLLISYIAKSVFFEVECILVSSAYNERVDI